MDEPRPVLVLMVPATLDTVPEGLDELRRHLSDDYGATLQVKAGTSLLPTVMRLYSGTWPAGVDDDIHPLVDAAFYSLDWMTAEDNG